MSEDIQPYNVKGATLIDKAKEYLKAGLSVIPTKEDKLPALATWKPYQATRLKEEEVDKLFTGANVKGLGIICGAISGGLEVIDVDTKHDTTGSLWDDLRTLIEDNLPELYNRLVIAQTKSGGYHLYYRCSQIKGNLKLATKLNKEVLIETRGEGGYVIAPPAPGYKYIQGEPGKIPTITPEEREVLFSIAKSFTEIAEPEPKVKTETTYQATGLSPFEDYNHRGDVVGLLESKGWRVVNQSGQRINLLRPGQTDSKSSGNFHTGLKVLRVFSSSTEFNPDKGYSPAQVFSLLECNEDNKLTYKRLLELGYGEPYNGQAVASTELQISQIKVTGVTTVNRKTSVIYEAKNSLKIQDLEGDSFIINSPGPEATEEVLKAIALIDETAKKIYIKEGDKPEVRSYQYRLQALIDGYNQSENTQRDIDKLLDGVVLISAKLEPVDKDIFLKDFLSLGGIAELGISQESLSITVDRLTATTDKEDQAKEFKQLLSQATALQDKGEVDKALELLDSKVKEVKLKDKATEFSSLLLPVSEAEIKARQTNKPDSLNSGYTIGGEELRLPSGAISILAAPTSHGKTTFLINLALNVAQAYPDKETYLFSYEEDGDSILINTLNTYLDEELSGNNRTTLKNYFAGKNQRTLSDKKDQFFNELIATRRLNINYSSYNSDTLIEAIRYIHKHAKPGAIFIDYIQLLNLPEGKYKTYSRQEEIKEICIALKDLAVETGLPIILGAQFNRTVENQLQLYATKIGEAGDIERIANLIIGFWNNNFKPIATDGELREIDAIGATVKDTLYTMVLKNRGGRVGLTELLSFNGNTGKIKNSSSSGSSYFK